MTFPQLDLPPEVHSRTRAELVRAASRPRLPRFVVPAVAALVVTAIVATGLAVAHQLAPLPTPAQNTGKHCNDTRPGTRADAKGLTYVPDLPDGWTGTASVDLVRYCEEPAPVAYYSGDTQGLQVFRGFSTRIAARMNPDTEAIKRLYESPLGPDDYGASVDVPYSPVDVGGHPGRLIRHDTVAWESDGQWWTVVSAEAGAANLVRYAAELRTDGDEVSWPGAKAAGFRRSEDEPPPDLPEGSWQPQWNVCLRAPADRSGPCTIAFRAARWEWSSGDGKLYPPQQALADRHKEFSGAGWTSPQGVVIWSWYASDAKTVRATVGSWHLVPLSSPVVTQLLDVGQEGTASSSS